MSCWVVADHKGLVHIPPNLVGIDSVVARLNPLVDVMWVVVVEPLDHEHIIVLLDREITIDDHTVGLTNPI